MPANTPKLGLPYPLGTDRVMDGDDAIHNLALALENGVLSGKICGGIAAIPANGGPFTVTFPAGFFTSPPAFVCSTSSASTTFLCGGGVPSAASCTITSFRRDGATMATAINCSWIAIGV